MAGTATAAPKGKGKAAPEAEAGLTPAPETATADEAVAVAALAEAGPIDRQYMILVGTDDIDGDVAWAELGTITASTRPDAWEQAKAKWADRLLPPTPKNPEEAQAQRPVLAKVVPARSFVTVESTVEYVAPRAVAKGI